MEHFFCIFNSLQNVAHVLFAQERIFHHNALNLANVDDNVTRLLVLDILLVMLLIGVVLDIHITCEGWDDGEEGESWEEGGGFEGSVELCKSLVGWGAVLFGEKTFCRLSHCHCIDSGDVGGGVLMVLLSGKESLVVLWECP